MSNNTRRFQLAVRYIAGWQLATEIRDHLHAIVLQVATDPNSNWADLQLAQERRDDYDYKVLRATWLKLRAERLLRHTMPRLAKLEGSIHV